MDRKREGFCLEVESAHGGSVTNRLSKIMMHCSILNFLFSMSITIPQVELMLLMVFVQFFVPILEEILEDIDGGKFSVQVGTENSCCTVLYFKNII